MSVFMIGYDLHEGEDYEDLIDAIKKLGNWWHCLDSTWLVATNSESGAIRDRLKPHLRNPDASNGDKLLVVQIPIPANSAWTLSFNQNCQEWLKNNFS
jgi:hypothetical protein